MANPDQMYDDAIALQEQGDAEGAVAKLEEILTVAPDHVLTHMALGVNLQKLGRLDDAVSHLSVICQRCGRIAEAEDAMAKAHLLQHGGH